MSLLLKFARAKDDQDFLYRIGAAMMVRAQEVDGWELPPKSRALVSWVFANPMEASDIMVRFVSTNAAVAGSVVTEMGGVDTSGVPDNDIQFVVNESWDQVAAKTFPEL